ncbi:selenocysteine-specific translation elongation factor [Naumannella halotolerans]|uniref:Selenocysteine-specific elongation factor n=1 Tax=Naumannella halotolerans TaxID=993414 RepID=A0A4R7JAG6_9ACTN|nr:selenocysteine-specific translation elongation factor [Naumannella halotolerans]TDT34365.1 selenocysteine-specific elongation factor [Naumannella halotolerans]
MIDKSSGPSRRHSVVATAGHVDHGKSTLIRSLTGIEPDRWAEERRRGLTIDLGFAWASLPSGIDVAYVDVPGHERFVTNMLAGLGPVGAVLFVVAADGGWQAQSSEHRDALAAFGIEHGVIALTRTDRVDTDRIAEVSERIRAEFAGTGLAEAGLVEVAAPTGHGLPQLRGALDAMLSRTPEPSPAGRLRFFLDRAFTITGAGAVVTGTLQSGSIAVGDRLDLHGERGITPVTVRGLQTENDPIERALPVSRVAVNLRGVGAEGIARGEQLLSPGAWRPIELVDLRLVSGVELADLPESPTLHLGTAAVGVALRPLAREFARVRLQRSLPLAPGDRVVLRDPGSARIAGAVVLDVDPPQFTRRGDAARRADALAAGASAVDARAEVRRRGVVARSELVLLGVTGADGPPPAGVVDVGPWWLDEDWLSAASRKLRDAVVEGHRSDPLAAGLSQGAAIELLGLPDPSLLATVTDRAGSLQLAGGYVADPDHTGMGEAEQALRRIEQRLASHPFDAPEADQLTAEGIGTRELAAAEHRGRLLRLTDAVVVLPNAPALAMRTLEGLSQPFTTSQARQALGATRRVAIPLLEHLDRRGWTRRIDGGHREVVR